MLRVTYSAADSGRTFDITMNGVKVATVELDGSREGDFFTVDYPVPQEALEKAKGGTLVTKFVAHPGSMAGGIFDVRLLRGEDTTAQQPSGAPARLASYSAERVGSSKLAWPRSSAPGPASASSP